MSKLCIRVDIDAPIELRQQGVDCFTVIYGKQVKKDLDYAEAASEFGAAVMHALACVGMLDNSEKGETH